MSRKLLFAVLYSLCTLALFGACAGALMGFVIPVVPGTPWYLFIVMGAIILLWFPGIMYIVGAVGSIVAGDQEVYLERITAFTSIHDPHHWVRWTFAKLRARKT